MAILYRNTGESTGYGKANLKYAKKTPFDPAGRVTPTKLDPVRAPESNGFGINKNFDFNKTVGNKISTPKLPEYTAPATTKMGDTTKYDFNRLGTDPKLSPKGPTTGGPGLDLATKGAQMGAKALDNIDDKDDTEYSGKEKAGDIGSAVLSGAATGTSMGATLAGGTGALSSILGTMGTFSALGSTVPILGTVAGAVIGGVIAGIKIKKNKKKAGEAKDAQTLATNKQESEANRRDLNTQDANIVGAPLNTGQRVVNASGYGYGHRRYERGGSFARIILKKASENSELKK